MKVIDFESRPHKAVTCVVERGKEKQEWNEQKLSRALPGHNGGRLPARSAEEKGREEGEECEKSEQGQKKNEIIEEGIGSSQRMALEGQNLCCSQIENEEEESWQEGDQMTEQLEEEQHLEDIVVRRRMKGSSLKLDVIQKVPELMVHERMSQSERVKKPKRKEERARMVH